jgi:hypothetical protein
MHEHGGTYHGLLKMNNWTSVFILHEQGPLLFYNFVRYRTESFLRKQNIQVALVQYTVIGKLDFGSLLDEFEKKSRGEHHIALRTFRILRLSSSLHSCDNSVASIFSYDLFWPTNRSTQITG